MGVQGLWQMLQSVGRPVSLESLQEKILAVDVSIWLHQAVKGMRDRDGNPVQNAHLISLFNKVCKLLFYRIKPVFVFDGGVPILKKKTLAGRRDRREYAEKQSNKATNKLVQNYLKSQAIRHVMGKTDDELILPSTSKSDFDVFALPPLPASKQEAIEDSDSSTEEQHLFQDHLQNLENVDIDSTDFMSLPSELQHEILTELKERKKRHSWYKLEQLPEESTDFSNYQMAKLLEKSKLSAKIEDVRKEMNERQTGELTQNLAEDYHGSFDVESRRVVSDDVSRYILIKGLSKKKKQAFALAQEQEKARLESLEKFFEETERKTTGNTHRQFSEETEQKIEMWQKHVNKNIELTNAFAHELSGGSQDKSPVIVSDESLSEYDLNFGQEISAAIRDRTGNTISEIVVGLSDEEDEYIGYSNVKASNDVKVISEATNQHKLSKLPTNISDLSDNFKMTDKSLVNGKPATVKNLNDSDKALSLPKECELREVIDIAEAVLSETASLPVVYNNVEVLDGDEEPGVHDTFDQHQEDGTMEDNNDDDDDLVEVPGLPCILSVENSEQETYASNHDKISAKAFPSSPSIHTLAEDEDVGYNEKDNSVPEPEQDLSNEFAGMTQESLVELQHELREEVSTLQAERGKQERMAVSITDQMYAEAQELLDLFGLPYLVSPMEAEAQCAFLDLTNQTHGSITDDSDIWLFGGKRVYKNFFNKGKLVEFFRAEDIADHFGLTRDKLIDIALLCGSDYTPGLQGVGPVTALEILAEFPGDKQQGLRDFGEWLEETNQSKSPHAMSKVRSKLHQLVIRAGFLDAAVVEAYLEPAVDQSQEPFTWAMPDLDSIRDFTRERLRWSQTKTDEVLVPVIQQLNKMEVQRRITSFFSPEAHEASIKVTSKRVKRTVNKLLNISDEEVSPEEVKKKRTVRKPAKKNNSQVTKKGQTKKPSATKHKSSTLYDKLVNQVKKKRISRVKDEVALSESSSDEGMNDEEMAAMFEDWTHDSDQVSSSSLGEERDSGRVKTTTNTSRQSKGKNSAKKPSKWKGKSKQSLKTEKLSQEKYKGAVADAIQKSKSGIKYSKRSMSSHLPL